MSDQRITPYLYYTDLRAALAFLRDAFGFEQFGETMEGPDGRLNHAAMKLQDGQVMMGCPGPDYRNPRQLGHQTQSLYVMVNDVDRHYQQALKAGAEILEVPEETSYGHRRYGAADPEGHHWYFAQPLGQAQP